MRLIARALASYLDLGEILLQVAVQPLHDEHARMADFADACDAVHARFIANERSFLAREDVVEKQEGTPMAAHHDTRDPSVTRRGRGHDVRRRIACTTRCAQFARGLLHNRRRQTRGSKLYCDSATQGRLDLLLIVLSRVYLSSTRYWCTYLRP